VKVGDFGLMQRIDCATGEAFIDETCGTFGFKAPELKKGAKITTKVIFKDLEGNLNLTKFSKMILFYGILFFNRLIYGA